MKDPLVLCGKLQLVNGTGGMRSGDDVIICGHDLGLLIRRWFRLPGQAQNVHDAGVPEDEVGGNSAAGRGDSWGNNSGGWSNWTRSSSW